MLEAEKHLVEQLVPKLEVGGPKWMVNLFGVGAGIVE